MNRYISRYSSVENLERHFRSRCKPGISPADDRPSAQTAGKCNSLHSGGEPVEGPPGTLLSVAARLPVRDDRVAPFTCLRCAHIHTHIYIYTHTRASTRHVRARRPHVHTYIHTHTYTHTTSRWDVPARPYERDESHRGWRTVISEFSRLLKCTYICILKERDRRGKGRKRERECVWVCVYVCVRERKRDDS